MRRFFTVYFDGSRWYARKGQAPPGTQKWYASMPHKQDFVDRLQEWQPLLIGTVRTVQSNETFPCFDGSGAPTDCPGVVTPQGALILDTNFNAVSLIDSFVDFSTTKPDPYQL